MRLIKKLKRNIEKGMMRNFFRSFALELLGI